MIPQNSSQGRPAPTGRGRRRALVIATTVALAGGLLLPLGTATAAPETTQPAIPSPRTENHEITLVTGDVVHYADGPGSQDTVTVDRADGATGGVRVQQSDGDLYVVPDEAAPLIDAGRLDRRLFDVTALVGMGYDDARTGGLPLIATYGAQAARALPAAPAGATVTRRLTSIGGTALQADKDTLRAFWTDVASAPKARTLDNGIQKLWLDARVEAALKDSVPQIGAPQAWAAGYDGKGVKVAVLDTGIDPNHPDVKDRIVESKSFVPGQEVLDKHGHGTHVASTVAGTGAASNGLNRGVAPGAQLLVGKVLSNEGYGTDSEIIGGMEWAKAAGADVVSMSLGSSVPDDGSDPMAQAVDALSADGGPLYVIAAGNSGRQGTIGSPGSAEKALTVAAVDKSDWRAGFSSQGPLYRSNDLKPDVSAPGVDITAAASQAVPNTTSMYRTMSGTSMATPHVAGAAAILKQRHPDWSGQQLKDALMSTSKQLAYTPYQQGTGRVDVKAVIDSTVQATGSVPVASYDWPHAATDAVAERTITYRNSGTQDVTLDLATNTDSAAYTLSANRITVPAGGAATAVLSLDPAKVPAGTVFSGQVVAKDAATGTVVAHTGFALQKESERYDLNVKVLDRDGKPASARVVLGQLGRLGGMSPINVDGETTLRLAPGTYAAWCILDVPGDTPDSQATAFLIDPETVLDKNATVVLDARKARKVSARTPRETETRQWRWDMARTASDGTLLRDVYMLPVKYDQLWATPTEQVTQGKFSFRTRWRLGQEAWDVEAGGSDLPVVVQVGSSVGTGRLKYEAVYAGDGATADYNGLDVRGKAVVIRRSDSVKPADRLANAVAAGAKAVFVVHDGRGRLSEGYGTASIPVASVQRDAGNRLIERIGEDRVELVIDQHRYAEYMYDLVSRHDGAIPDRSLAYTPDDDELARVENTFYGHRNVVGGGFRYDIPEYGPGVGFQEWESYPGTRTEWVSQQSNGAFWYEDHSIFKPGSTTVDQQERGGNDQLTAGRVYRTDWFAPVQRPRLGTAFWGPHRTMYGYMQFNMTPWTDDAPGHSGSMPADAYNPGVSSSALYQGDTLVQGGIGQALYLRTPVPAETLPYRLVLDAKRDGAVWKTSVRTHTEWGFRSGAVSAEVMDEQIRLLQLDYGVDTDLAGDVTAGRKTVLRLSSATQEWLDGQVKADEATLSVSYDDGKSWTPVQLDKNAAGAWTATLDLPATPGAFVSLKATAKGADGLTVNQEIIRAFGLK
ncbi:S8 family serine peptidase [Streptomyces sp. NPDC048623]|uniref:S8 family peptidase n=1 Tax=Streptomyces sp. NPDC048623 TaxID=3155761 RepID=UPI00343E29A2